MLNYLIFGFLSLLIGGCTTNLDQRHSAQQNPRDPSILDNSANRANALCPDGLLPHPSVSTEFSPSGTTLPPIAAPTPTPVLGSPYEVYFGPFFSSASIRNTSATVTDIGIFTPPTTTSKYLHFSSGTGGGLRGGMWGHYFGFAMELSNLSFKGEAIQPDSGHVKANYTTFTLKPLLRLPLFPSKSIPGGHVNLYTGITLSAMTGNINLEIPEQSRTVSSSVSGGGVGTLFGTAIRYSRLGVFAEYRRTKTNLSDQDTGLLFTDINMSVEATEMMLGLDYRFW